LAHAILGLPHRAEDINRTALTTVVLFAARLFSAISYVVVSRLSYLEASSMILRLVPQNRYHDQWLSVEAHFAQKTGGQSVARDLS